MIPRHNAMIKL